MSEGWIEIARIALPIGGTALVIFLGQWIQRRWAREDAVKRREQELEDEARHRQWALSDEERRQALAASQEQQKLRRTQLEKHLNLLKGYTDDSLQSMAKLSMLFPYSKGDTQTWTEFTEFVQKSSAVIAEIEAVPDETQLADLLEKFNASLMGFLRAKDEEEVATAQKEAQKTAITINRRIDELWTA